MIDALALAALAGAVLLLPAWAWLAAAGLPALAAAAVLAQARRRGALDLPRTLPTAGE